MSAQDEIDLMHYRVLVDDAYDECFKRLVAIFFTAVAEADGRQQAEDVALTRFKKNAKVLNQAHAIAQKCWEPGM